MTQDKCICIENITDLALSNASECMTSCADDSNDTCGAEGRMILHEIGKIELNVIIVLFLSSGMFHPILLCICLVNRCRWWIEGVGCFTFAWYLTNYFLALGKIYIFKLVTGIQSILLIVHQLSNHLNILCHHYFSCLSSYIISLQHGLSLDQ